MKDKLSLVKEGGEWRIFLDWTRGVTIPLRAIMAESDGPATLDVSLLRKQAIIQPGEVFEVDVEIKNRTQSRSSHELAI